MLIRSSLLLALMLGSAPAMCQEQRSTITCLPSETRLVVGEPLSISVTIDWREAVLLPQAIAPIDIEVELSGPTGSVFSPSGAAPLQSRPFVPPPEAAFKAGDEVRLELSDVMDTYLCAPGDYSLSFHFRAQPSYTAKDKYWKGELVSAPIRVTLTRPEGEDSKVWALYNQEALQRPPELSYLSKLGCQPFVQWIAYKAKDILKDFPTSTYAGYALARNYVGFSNQPLSWLDDPDGNILNYYRTPDGRIGVTQAHIDSDKAAMVAFAKSAGPFLEAHPNFIKAPLIRRMYAMCLGLTGCMPEALDQVRVLAQGQGKEAEEAKAYLAAKEKK